MPQRTSAFRLKANTGGCLPTHNLLVPTPASALVSSRVVDPEQKKVQFVQLTSQLITREGQKSV